MKKVWLWGLALALGMALAVPAMAVDWSATGWIGSSAAIYENVPAGSAFGYLYGVSPSTVSVNVARLIAPFGSSSGPGAGIDDHDVEKFWTRGRLKLTARASENLYGVFYFEMDSSNWGESGSGRNHMGRWGADQVAVEVKNVFVDFRIPGIDTPVWMRVGIQPFAIRPHFLLYADGAGITLRSKIDKVTLGAGWAKVYDSATARESDDVDMYYFMASGKVGGFTLGGYWLYEDAEENALGQTGGMDTDLHWLGTYLSGKVADVKLTFDFAYMFGETNDAYGTADVDYSGFYLRGVASYAWDKFEIGFGGHYASGPDAEDIASDYAAGRSTDYDGFLYPYCSEAFAINNDSVIFGGWFIGFANQGDIGNPFAYWPLNTWGLRAFLHYQALDWLKLGFQVAYWGDTVDGADMYGSDVDALLSPTDDDEIGWEFDVGAKVKVYKNLTWGVAFGYLIAGDALEEQWDGRRNWDADDPWALVSNLVYTF